MWGPCKGRALSSPMGVMGAVGPPGLFQVVGVVVEWPFFSRMLRGLISLMSVRLGEWEVVQAVRGQSICKGREEKRES